MKLLHKGLILISVPLAFEVVFAVGFYSLLSNSWKDLQAEVHVKKVVANCERMQILLSESSFLVAINFQHKSPGMDARYDNIWNRIVQSYQNLKTLETTPGFVEKVAAVKGELNYIRKFQKFFWSGPGKLIAKGPGNDENPGMSNYFLEDFKRRRTDRNTPLDSLIKAELASVRQGSDLHQAIHKEFERFIIAGIVGDIIILVLLGVFFGQSIERHLRNVLETTRRLARGEDLPAPLKGYDEIAKLDLLLHDTASQILDTQRFKRQLIGVVCHELKAPLSAIHILLSLIANEKDKLSAQASKTINVALRSCNRLQLMVSELLDLESMNADKVELRCVPTKPSDVMDSAVEMVRAIAADRSVEILAEPCTAEASIDPDRVVQVLVNLLSNAIKFSPQGGQVRMKAIDSESDLVFEITDQGPGIPEELHDSVFEVFSQGKKPEYVKIKGTGMGLSICKAIVTAHGGTIKVISKEGAGCTFRVTLPKTPRTVDRTALMPKKEESGKKLVGLRIRHKGMILIGLPVVTQMVLVASLASLLTQADEQINKQTRARQVVYTSQVLLQELADAALLVLLGGASAERDELYAQQESILNRCLETYIAHCKGDEPREKLARDISKQIGLITETHRYLVEESKKRRLTADNIGDDRVNAYMGAWTHLSDEIQKVAAREENIEEEDALALNTIIENIGALLIAGVSVNVLAAIVLAALLTQNITKRIDLVKDNAERILAKKPLLPPVSGTDEIAELDRAFHDAANALEQEQELKKKLMAIASHELRSPLAAISMSLALLTSGEIGQMSDKNVQRIKQAEAGSHRLLALVNDIMDIEKMEAGKFELQIEDVELGATVTRAIACVQPLADEKGVRFAHDVADTVVKADAERLIQVLINLLSNAIKFSQSGQTVRIISEVKNDELSISIIDSGKGISTEVQGRIFEQFVKDSGDGNAVGSGLGLSICKAIVEQHGGTIGCDSAEGNGTRFWFVLPHTSRAITATGVEGTI